MDEVNESTNLSHSLGLTLDKNAVLTDVIWEGPAFFAGAAPGMTLIAINGKAYTRDLLEQAIRNARDQKSSIALLVKNLDTYRTLEVQYRGGLRYPHLERIEGTTDLLTDIFKPRSVRSPR